MHEHSLTHHDIIETNGPDSNQTEMKGENRTGHNILAIDCCEHIIEVLAPVLNSNLKSVSSKENLEKIVNDNEIKLIVIGSSDIPVRRMFFSRLRQFCPETPILFLRRKTIDNGKPNEALRGEFMLSDKRRALDLELVRALRKILPLEPCLHAHSEFPHRLVRDVTRVLTENYSDVDLDLRQVADQLAVSPTRLSRVLNRQVNISFRQMLRQIRIEEAKRLIATRRFSIKEVARRVGFSDSHYFSRTFKELTGLNPTQYEYDPRELFLSE